MARRSSLRPVRWLCTTQCPSTSLVRCACTLPQPSTQTVAVKAVVYLLFFRESALRLPLPLLLLLLAASAITALRSPAHSQRHRHQLGSQSCALHDADMAADMYGARPIAGLRRSLKSAELRAIADSCRVTRARTVRQRCIAHHHEGGMLAARQRRQRLRACVIPHPRPHRLRLLLCVFHRLLDKLHTALRQLRMVSLELTASTPTIG